MLRLVVELLVRRDVRHLDALAVRRVFPSMVGAAQPVCFDAAEVERREAMRTIGADETDSAGARAKEHQVLAEEPHAQRPAAGFLQMGRWQHWSPILAHKVAHRSRRTNA